MEKAYRKARRRQDEAIEGGPARIEAELTALSHKYPFFQDFEVTRAKSRPATRKRNGKSITLA